MSRILNLALLLAALAGITSACQDLTELQPDVNTTTYVENIYAANGIDPGLKALSPTDAEKVAARFYATAQTKSPNKKIKEVKPVKDPAGKVAFYIVNLSDNAGFLFVSATKNYIPILGYGENGTIGSEEDILPSGLSDLIQEYIESIQAADQEANPTDSLQQKYAASWAAYENQPEPTVYTKATYNRQEEVRKWEAKGYECFNLAAIRNFLPASEADLFIRDIGSHAVDGMNSTVLLIKRSENQYGPMTHTQWGQTYLPFNINASNGYAGCGPIAMAQVMRYHQWPTTYNWSAIGYNPAPNNAQAQRMILDIRKAADVTYDSKGTGTTSDKMKHALEHNFNYTAQVMNYYGYSERLKAANEIKWSRPVIMSGFSATPQGDIGHTWVAEGYKENIVSYAASYLSVEPGASGYEYYTGTTKINSEYFYMNWGRSGEFDGWFYSDLVNMSDDRNYNKKREIIISKPNK